MADNAKNFPNWIKKENTDRFFQWGIKVGKDLHMAKYRFNQTFRLVNTEDFIKDLLNDKQVQASFPPMHGVGPITDIKSSQL